MTKEEARYFGLNVIEYKDGSYAVRNLERYNYYTFYSSLGVPIVDLNKPQPKKYWDEGAWQGFYAILDNGFTLYNRDGMPVKFATNVDYIRLFYNGYCIISKNNKYTLYDIKGDNIKHATNVYGIDYNRIEDCEELKYYAVTNEKVRYGKNCKYTIYDINHNIIDEVSSIEPIELYADGYAVHELIPYKK